MCLGELQGERDARRARTDHVAVVNRMYRTGGCKEHLIQIAESRPAPARLQVCSSASDRAMHARAECVRCHDCSISLFGCDARSWNVCGNLRSENWRDDQVVSRSLYKTRLSEESGHGKRLIDQSTHSTEA